MSAHCAQIAEGRFKREIIPFGELEHDEPPRESSLEKMATLRTPGRWWKADGSGPRVRSQMVPPRY